MERRSRESVHLPSMIIDEMEFSTDHFMKLFKLAAREPRKIHTDLILSLCCFFFSPLLVLQLDVGRSMVGRV